MKLSEDQLLKWYTIFSESEVSFITGVHNEELSTHPLVIFYNEHNRRVYYLKGQTYRNQWFYNENETYFYKIEANKGEEYFQPNPNIKNPYIYKTTIFDTSTTYEMDLEDFIEEFNLSESYSYLKLKPEHQFNILKNLYFNFKNDNIARKKVNLSLEIINNKERIVSKSYYSYVSEEYLIRNLKYESRDVNSFDLDSLIKEFNLDVREEPLSYSATSGIINSAFSEFKYNNPSFANEVNKLYDNERKKTKERSR